MRLGLFLALPAALLSLRWACQGWRSRDTCRGRIFEHLCVESKAASGVRKEAWGLSPHPPPQPSMECPEGLTRCHSPPSLRGIPLHWLVLKPSGVCTSCTVGGSRCSRWDRSWLLLAAPFGSMRSRGGGRGQEDLSAGAAQAPRLGPSPPRLGLGPPCTVSPPPCSPTTFWNLHLSPGSPAVWSHEEVGLGIFRTLCVEVWMPLCSREMKSGVLWTSSHCFTCPVSAASVVRGHPCLITATSRHG